jgi:hypothetical protein
MWRMTPTTSILSSWMIALQKILRYFCHH